MLQPDCLSRHWMGQNDYWMRAISFAGLHRLLNAVAGFPNGLRASEINELVGEKGIALNRRSSHPAPTTLYHYRNTLLQLRALTRDGRKLRVNDDNPDVRKLLGLTAPANGDHSLSYVARDPFAALVLKNEQCRSRFFNLFMRSDACFDSVSSFRQNGVPVTWIRHRSSQTSVVIFVNNTTGYTARCESPVSVAAILYGVRYWARDELGLIDEYCRQADGGTLMFPVSPPGPSAKRINSPVRQTAYFLLSLRSPSEWTRFSVLDLIARCCVARRQPISVLFNAIDWLLKEWPNHTVPIPTSRALATLTATSPQREALELRKYYKTSNGPYISHIRVHKDISVEPTEPTDHDARHSRKTEA